MFVSLNALLLKGLNLFLTCADSLNVKQKILNLMLIAS